MAEADNTPTDDPEMERLRAEIANLRAVLAERAQDVREAVNARAEAVRSNPATHGAALAAGSIIGVLIGLAIGQANRRN